MRKVKELVGIREYTEARPWLRASKLRQYCRAGVIPSIKQGPCYMFDPDIMDAYIEWLSMKNVKEGPGSFMYELKRMKKELTSIAAYRARQKEEVGT